MSGLLRQDMLLALLLALSTLGSIGWAIHIAWEHPYDGLDWITTGHITSIDPAGPTAQSRLQVGDRVVAIDGQPWQIQVAPYFGKVQGERVDLTVVRAGESLSVAFRLTTPPRRIRLFLLEPLLISLVFWGIGLITWMLHPRQRVAQLFLLMSQIIATLLAMGLLSVLNVPVGIMAFTILLPLSAAVMFHFYTLFPRPLPQRLQRRLVGAIYGVTAGLIGVTLLIFVLVHTIPPAVRTGQRGLVALMLLGALGLLYRPSTATSVTDHRRLRVMLVGMTLSLLPMLGLSFLPELLWGIPVISYFGTFPFLVLLPISYAYVVLHDNLGWIDRLINHSVVYGILSAGWIGIYTLVYGILNHLFPLLSFWNYALIGSGLAILVAVLFVPIRSRVQHRVDYLFYGGWYDYRSIVQAVSAELIQTRDSDHMVGQLLDAMQAMHFRSAVCFWADGQWLVGKGCYGTELTSFVTLHLPADGALACMLRVTPNLYRQADLYATLNDSLLVAAEHTLLSASQAQLWLPLVRNGKLHGLLVLGDRRGGDFLVHEDQAILVTLVQQAAVAAENMWLVAGLRDQLQQVEQMRDELIEVKQRLVESREAERLRLAQDLHDGPLQDIYSISFCIGALQREPGYQVSCMTLQQVETTLQNATHTLRTICGELRPSVLVPFGLEKAIRSHLDSVRTIHSTLHIDCDLMSDGQILPTMTRLALFRVYQEALQNAVRHAQARWALVRLHLDDQEVVLEVRDDGCGFRVPARWIDLARQGHLGLLGAAERMEAVGGRFIVNSAPGAGTVVQAILPRAAAQEAENISTHAKIPDQTSVW
ncbi:MAG: ATP-binding protein [Chloroflexaceae bacterium]